MVKEFLKKHRLLVLFITLLCIPLIITFSRYIAKVITDYYLEAKNFYFNSDKLKSDHPTYQINNWNGIDKVDFVINLDSKKNELKVADMDIDYNIEFTCESDVICSTNKNNGVINNETNVDSFTLSVTPKRTFNKNESTTVNVIATSKNPYVKSLGARFIIKVGEKGVGYEIVDSVNSPYLMLNITNALTNYTILSPFDNYKVGDQINESIYLTLTDEQKSKCASAIISLKFDPNIILLDTTNKIMKIVTDEVTSTINGEEYLSGITFKLDSSSSTAIRFYKKNKQMNYTYPIINDTSIIEFNVGGD